MMKFIRYKLLFSCFIVLLFVKVVFANGDNLTALKASPISAENTEILELKLNKFYRKKTKLEFTIINNISPSFPLIIYDEIWCITINKNKSGTTFLDSNSEKDLEILPGASYTLLFNDNCISGLICQIALRYENDKKVHVIEKSIFISKNKCIISLRDKLVPN